LLFDFTEGVFGVLLEGEQAGLQVGDPGPEFAAGLGAGRRPGGELSPGGCLREDGLGLLLGAPNVAPRQISLAVRRAGR
jgi:hypothetical protein